MMQRKVSVGGCELRSSLPEVNGGYVERDGESFYRIRHADRLPPFFMSIVSDSNHWMFISSNGALTCGRRNPGSALFPYCTEDKIHDAQEHTGPKTIVLVEGADGDFLWEPFSARFAGIYETERNLYKNVPGNIVLFEEINHTLQLSFSYKWMSSDRYGFVREAVLANLGTAAVTCRFVDGLQNLLPSNVDRDLQNAFSTLVDAYKRSELLPATGIGMFALSSVPVDRAEPSESLTANTVWSTGLDHPLHLLSSRQLDTFRRGGAVDEETDVCGTRGAYLVCSTLHLDPGASGTWLMVAEVDQDAGAIAALEKRRPSVAELLSDVQRGTENLKAIVAEADGIQSGGDPLQTARHFSNTLFNVMRGGIFAEGYQVERSDLLAFIRGANRTAAAALPPDTLPERFHYAEGLASIRKLDHADLERLYLEYLPLTFSRRHGDPSRPWNSFSIETRNADGSKKLYFQGNWRDIFQNWEALGISYPGFLESMICKFVNASTADGYNPYRITRDGIDWETVDPRDPWSYIGYWGDHQIIYLLKLLERAEEFYPGRLHRLLDREIFSYANVPYRIRPYEDLLKNPFETIVFDEAAHAATMRRVERIGSDGRLVHAGNEVLRVNLAEKLLVPLLAKLSNFVPEAGIWMNTQRPEWNDANNALVGNGVSMVTLCYIRRYLVFCSGLFMESSGESFAVSSEVAGLFDGIFDGLKSNAAQLSGGFDNARRRGMLDLLGSAGSRYREILYRQEGLSGTKTRLSVSDLLEFLEVARRYMDQSIDANRRADGLYHAYNLMKVESDGGISIRYLYEMLEGQVAVLSSGRLDAAQSLEVLDALRSSPLYRPDQHSYILYPNRSLPRFMEKNRLPDGVEPDARIVSLDCGGVLHFRPEFRNAAVLAKRLDEIRCPEAQRKEWLALYEQVFDHQSFTGRSGTFFKYEGLGSIYWHMVSKLLIAVQDICIRAAETEFMPPLRAHYHAIRNGIGAHKSVGEQGAFPTDPYSHTPSMMGAQQPGLTGQVKEDFIIRLWELGVRVENGRVRFDRSLSTEPEVAFTLCTVPVQIMQSGHDRICVSRADGSTVEIDGTELDEELSAEIFGRTGAIAGITVEIKARSRAAAASSAKIRSPQAVA